VSPALEIVGMEMPRLAKRAARESGIRVMVHIGDTEKRYDPNVIHPLLSLLEPGDILTHYFTPNPGGVLDANGKLVPEATVCSASRDRYTGSTHATPLGGAPSALRKCPQIDTPCQDPGVTKSPLSCRCRRLVQRASPRSPRRSRGPCRGRQRSGPSPARPQLWANASSGGRFGGEPPAS
jgi:hypothetical protein